MRVGPGGSERWQHARVHGGRGRAAAPQREGQLSADVLTGQHVEEGVAGAVQGGQAQRDVVRHVDPQGETARPLLANQGQVWEGGARQEDQVVRREAHQENCHNGDHHHSHPSLLAGLQGVAGPHGAQDAPVGHGQQHQWRQETQEETGVVEPRHRFGGRVVRLKASPLAVLCLALAHQKDREMGCSHHRHDRHGDAHRHAFSPETAHFQGVLDGDVAVAGDAAQQQDADVHVGEEDEASHLAGDGAPEPHVALGDVERPQGKRGQVGQVAHRQAPQVDPQHILTQHLAPGEPGGEDVGGESHQGNHAVEDNQGESHILVRKITCAEAGPVGAGPVGASHPLRHVCVETQKDKEMW